MSSELYFYHDVQRDPLNIQRPVDLKALYPQIDWQGIGTVTVEPAAENVFSLTVDQEVTSLVAGQVPSQIGTLPLSIGALSDDLQVFELTAAGEQVWVSGKPGTDLTIKAWERTSAAEGFVLTRGLKFGWLLTALTPLFVDGALIGTGEKRFVSKGLEVSAFGQLLKIYDDEIHLTGSQADAILPRRGTSRYTTPVEFPQYHRSPRLILRAPEDAVTLAPPEPAPKAPTGGLVRMILPSLAGVAATVVMGLAMGRGWLTLLMAGVTVVTTILTVTQYFSNKKQFRVDVKNRKENYDEYLEDKVREIWKFNQKQREAAEYHYPPIAQLAEMAATVNLRLYEKMPQHFDFLTYRLGLGTVPASIDLHFEARADQKKDPVAKRAVEAHDELATLDSMPITVDLMHGVVGYVGSRPLVLEQLQLMMLQLATFHSYHDLEFVMVFPEEEKENWWWSRWLKQTRLHAMNVRGFVYDQRSRDQILGSLNTLLKERKNAKAEAGREEIFFAPHIVIVVTDQTLIMDHVIMEFLQDDPRDLNVSVIYVEDVVSSLRENVQTVIDIRDSSTGNLIMQEGVVKNTAFSVDHFPENFDKEQMARDLGGLDHLLNLQSTIPERLNFLEMYGVQTVDELDIAGRWAAGSPRKTMAVPIGWRATEDTVYLNLHEKADGPHGLLAGTTGSGKTEVVKDLVTSLAVNFRPDHVAFLPIDFKGGALANDLKPLPHTLGAITNLDAASANRALASIQAEMRRRQALFTEAGVSNINDYHTELEAGKDLEPIPHLVMISDEFAELKSQMPDFLDQLVSVARVGRSLGVHLILATQKPAGVVNDQIWANSRFKIALKVAEAADSKEILKTPDAADITQTGRGYLQVGNNEKYELFQTAYSGAPYEPDGDQEEDSTLLLYQINDLGQPELLNPDLSKGNDDSSGLQQSQMEAIVDKINEIFDDGHYIRPAAVWLPPLETRMNLDELREANFIEEWQSPQPELVFTLGLMDIPTQQAQRNLEINLSEDGHIVFFGSSGYGRTTALQTAMLDLAIHHPVDSLQMYVFDFGTNGLAPMRGLPHVHGFFGIDQEDEIRDWLNDMQTIIEDRKDKLAEALVANTEVYFRKTGERLPDIVVIIDAYEAKRQERWDSEFDQLLLTVLRSGAAVGLHVIMNASRANDIRSNLMAGIKDRFMFYLNDDSDKSFILGRTQEVVPDIVGRGLIRVDGEVVAAQVALPVAGEDELAILDGIEVMTKQMNDNLGRTPEDEPIVKKASSSKQLSVDQLDSMPDVQQALADGDIVLGTNSEQGVVYLSDDEQKLVVISSDDKKQVDDIVAGITATMTDPIVVNRDNIQAFNQNTLPRLLDGTLSNQTVVFHPAYLWLEDYDSNSIMVELGVKTIGTTEDGQYLPTALLETDNKFIFADIRSNFMLGEELLYELELATTVVYAGDWDTRVLMDSENDDRPKKLKRNQFYAQIDREEIEIINRIRL